VTIGIVDTSVFCNILDIPGRNQHRDEAFEALEGHLNKGITLLLPLAAVYETGNHIAHIGDGGNRRKAAIRFVEQVESAINGNAPWTPTPIPDQETMIAWLDEFPDNAMREISLADLSIIKEFENQCRLHRMRRVFVWSYDADLSAYDRQGG
jgi:predicted nucleic acid-binding protein